MSQERETENESVALSPVSVDVDPEILEDTAVDIRAVSTDPENESRHSSTPDPSNGKSDKKVKQK